jgi:hypothetical protein
MAMPNKLIAVDMFAGGFVFSSQIPVGFINYKGVRNLEFQEISGFKTELSNVYLRVLNVGRNSRLDSGAVRGGGPQKC